MKKALKITAIVLLVTLLLSMGGFLLWAETAAGPGPAALELLNSTDKVSVVVNNDYIAFEPVAPTSTGFIFYPGGRVDYRAYAPILRKIADQGYLVVLVPVRLNLAFFDVNAAETVLTDFPQIEHWAIGGHSLGGVAGALFAGTHPQIEGIVYWASYPTDDRLKNSGIKMMSIYATHDGLATPAKIEASKANLPADTLFVSIEGGNHAQFGDYGPQAGDNPAAISAASQWQQTADATVQLLNLLGK